MSMEFRVETNIGYSRAGHVYFNKPTQVEIDKAFNLISAECYDLLTKKYGDWTVAKYRLDEALGYLKDSNTAFHMLVLRHIAELAKEKNDIVICRSSSSIVEYLLDITIVDPLPPHHICPVCKRIEMREDVADGFDLQPQKCSVCGTDMTRNGHNCSESIGWSSKWNSMKSYDILVTETTLCHLQKHLSSCLSETESDSSCYCSVAFSTPLDFNCLNVLQRVTDKCLRQIPMDEKTVWTHSLQNFLESRESEIELPMNCLISFHDLLQVIGLEMSHYREKQYGMINKPYCATFRDFDKTQITYLFPKASCVNIAMQLYYMMWYENNYPNEYEVLMKELEA